MGLVLARELTELPRDGLDVLGRRGGERSGGSRRSLPRAGLPSSWVRMARPSTSASSEGTALPSWRCCEVRPPVIVTSSGNVCRRQRLARMLRRRLLQWNGPIAGPGCAWIVQDGRRLASFRRKLQ